MVVTYSASRPNYRPARFDKPQPDMALLNAIEIFLIEHQDITEGKFGCLSCRSYYIIRAIKAGARIMPKTEKSIRAFIAGYRR